MASSDDTKRGSNPGSVLLQDMLREKKAQTQRIQKTYDPGSQLNGRRNGVEDRNIQSSPHASTSSRDRSGASGRRSSGPPKVMGLKEMEEHISKINKQNFDLKLELFHRRQRNEELEARLEKVETLDTDNQELQSINEDLLLELEKRDVAIQEAVGLICELEAKIEEMGEAESYFRQRGKTPEPDRSVQEHSVPASPESAKSGLKDSDHSRHELARNTRVEDQAQPGRSVPSGSPQRVPSFLRDTNKSTTVLRSLYLNDGSQTQGNPSSLSLARPGSVFSGEEEDDDYVDRHMLNSPRLSILSESGFSSIYGSPKARSLSPGQNLDGHVAEHSPTNSQSQRNNQRNARLQDWLEERNRPSTPPRQTSKVRSDDQFSSIDQVLEKVPSNTKGQQPEKSLRGESKPRQERTPDKPALKQTRERQRRPSSPAFGGPMFGGGLLPPTPDTMSTATVAPNSSTPSIVTEKSLFDGTAYPGKGFSTLIPNARPRTSDSSLASNFGTALVYHQGHTSLQASPSKGRSSRAEQRPVRPSLTTSTTETIFNADGSSPTRVSRTLSYPSPTGRTRRLSNQLSPVSSRGSNPPGEKTPTLSPRDGTSVSGATATPRRRSPRGTPQRSPTAMRDRMTPTPIGKDPQPAASTNFGRSTSLRSKMAKISLAPNQSAQKSVASRLFRRSNSQSVQNPPNAQSSSPSRPPVAHARLPRPTSLYGSSPIYAPRPGTADSDQNAGQAKTTNSFLPVNVRRHSAVFDGGNGWSDQLGLDRRQHQGNRESESRQTMRTEAQEGRKWGLGRLGFNRRSMSIQHV